MLRPASRLIELNTCSGPTRSSSSTGGMTATTIRRLVAWRRAALRDAGGRWPLTMELHRSGWQARRRVVADFDGSVSRIDVPPFATMRGWGTNMTNRWPALAAAMLLAAAARPADVVAQAEKGPYARIAILRPHNGDTVDFEAG